MVEITFYTDSKKTCTLMVDYLPTLTEIPYNPEKLVDHRGYFLWRYLGDNGITWDEVKFVNLSKGDVKEITRGFDYCDSGFPEIKKEILKREKQKLRR